MDGVQPADKHNQQICSSVKWDTRIIKSTTKETTTPLFSGKTISLFLFYYNIVDSPSGFDYGWYFLCWVEIEIILSLYNLTVKQLRKGSKSSAIY